MYSWTGYILCQSSEIYSMRHGYQRCSLEYSGPNTHEYLNYSSSVISWDPCSL